MNEGIIMPRKALISVSDKTHLTGFAEKLHALDIEIISTGGTARHLQHADIPVTIISELTGFPEIMDGRVKTLHPLVFAGLLGKRDEHAEQAKHHGIEWIDLLICNLYPFLETIQQHSTFEKAIENIDIGGPAMIRAAAKNMQWANVIVDPSDYDALIEELHIKHGTRLATRKQFAKKAFAHTARYDTMIQHYLDEQSDTNTLPDTLNLSYDKVAALRYGENPHQQAAAYQAPCPHRLGILQTTQHQGKALSYNNILDSDAAWACMQDFEPPTCVIVKHNNPCGVAVRDTIENACRTAWAADSQSAFGSIIALNQACTAGVADFLVQQFIEVVIAPSYDSEALKIFQTKPRVRLLALELSPRGVGSRQYTSIQGGLLVQTEDDDAFHIEQCTCVTEQAITPEQAKDLAFAWRVVKHVKSNAIVIAKNHSTLGIGAGQVSRIDAVGLAIAKSQGNTQGATLASDAFFPFADNIEAIAKAGISAIIQPGGSIKDQDIIDACNQYNIAMLLTGKRCFKH
jgi:phosphoribosylaminoimidazolecarboxamide formyltransferase/IMP cyclohydrolase